MGCPLDCSNVILHAFDWSYSRIAEKANEISAMGYRSVLVSPPMKSAKSEQRTPWWLRYQPQDYRVIDNQLGDTHDFINMVNTLSALDIYVYVDVVFNHMANESSLRDDLTYPNSACMQQYRSSAQYYQSLCLFGDLSTPLFTEHDFVTAFGIEDWQDKWQVQNGRLTGGPLDPGLPTLDDNTHVVQQQQNYLKALKKLGVKGFRIDAAKHMSLEHLQKVWTTEITQGMHIFGEIITDGGAKEAEYELFLKPYLEETRLSAYDFPLFSTIASAFAKEGSLTTWIDPYCFGQALSKLRSITFTITHDIPNNAVFSNHVMSEEHEALAYSYIMGRDGGVPLIYTDLDTSGIKNKAGDARWQNSWRDPMMAKRIAFYHHVHGEPMTILEANHDLLVFSRGEKGIVVINKSRRAANINLSWPHHVLNIFTDELLTVKQDKLNVTIAAKQSAMFISQLPD